jgi:hypothetical protein
VNLHIGIPQAIMLLLLSIAVIGAAVEHGKPSGTHSVFWAIGIICFELSMLWWGGFFSPPPVCQKQHVVHAEQQETP